MKDNLVKAFVFGGFSSVLAFYLLKLLKKKKMKARKEIFNEKFAAVKCKSEIIHSRLTSAMNKKIEGNDTLGYWGMVAASQKYASVAGIEILKIGGNAIDAAIAMAAVLCVTEPGSTDLGGDCFALIFDKGYVLGVNGSGRSSRHATRERVMRDLNLDHDDHQLEPATFNGHNVTVPGCVAAWCDMHQNFGTLSLRQILTPAIRLAKYGFCLGDKAQKAVDECNLYAPKFIATLLKKNPQNQVVVQRPEMAQVLEEIAMYGSKAFYFGKTAEAIEYAVKNAGGCLDVQDLAQHSTEFTQAISTQFAGVTVWEHRPNCAGIVVLVALNILNKLLPSDIYENQAKLLHFMIEALRWSFFECRKNLGSDNTPVSNLLSDEIATRLASQIEPHTATAVKKIQEQESQFLSEILHFGGTDTVSFQVIDAQGQAVSFVNSTYQSFGSKLSARGFSLQNRGHNFTTLKNHINCIAPQKKPYHTIMPCLVTRPSDGALLATLTNMGGFMQPSGHVQHLVNLFILGNSPQASVDAPRFCLKNIDKPFGSMDPTTYFEPHIDTTILKSLQNDYGHSISLLPKGDVFTCAKTVGKAQIILHDPETGLLRAGSDQRADGTALACTVPCCSRV